jgi:hypothetical protein
MAQLDLFYFVAVQHRMTCFDSDSDNTTSPFLAFVVFGMEGFNSFLLQQLVVQPCNCFTVSTKGIQLPYFSLLKNWLVNMVFVSVLPTEHRI